jgi:hypothetical protein
MTMAAVLDDVTRLAQFGMIRASPDATGRRFQASV